MKIPLSPGLLQRTCWRRGHREDGGREYARPAKMCLQVVREARRKTWVLLWRKGWQACRDTEVALGRSFC